MQIGLMPYDVAYRYGVGLSRRVVYATTWSSWFKRAYTQPISLNINCSVNKGDYATDLPWFQGKVQSIVKTLKPFDVAIQNEELLDGDIIKYGRELLAASEVAKVTNGGITQADLGYLYYQQNPQDSEFFNHNVFQKDAYMDGVFIARTLNTNYLIEILMSSNIPYINVHYYIGYPEQAPGLIRMFKWLSSITGKPLTCNEAGVYRAGLLQLVVDVARECGMQYLILYSGLGTEGKALPINKELFLSLI